MVARRGRLEGFRMLGVHMGPRLLAVLGGFVYLSLTLAGCPLGLDLATLPCDGSPCDPQRYALAELFLPHPFPADSDPNLPTFRARLPCGGVEWGLKAELGALREELLANPDRTGGSNADLRVQAWSIRPVLPMAVALAREPDGELLVAPLGQPGLVRPGIMGVRGLAWSNGGDFLAVVTRDEAALQQQAHELVLLSADLNELARFSLDLPLSDPQENIVHDRFVVSWSADDALVAVSTTAVCSMGLAVEPCDERVRPRCNVVRRSDGLRRVVPMTDAWFVGEQDLVASVASDRALPVRYLAYRVSRVSLDNQLRVCGQVPLIGPVYVLSGFAPAGVFLAEDPPVATLDTVVATSSLRTADGRRQFDLNPIVLGVSQSYQLELPPLILPGETTVAAVRDAGRLPDACR